MGQHAEDIQDRLTMGAPPLHIITISIQYLNELVMGKAVWRAHAVAIPLIFEYFMS